MGDGLKQLNNNNSSSSNSPAVVVAGAGTGRGWRRHLGAEVPSDPNSSPRRRTQPAMDNEVSLTRLIYISDSCFMAVCSSPAACMAVCVELLQGGVHERSKNVMAISRWRVAVQIGHELRGMGPVISIHASIRRSGGISRPRQRPHYPQLLKPAAGGDVILTDPARCPRLALSRSAAKRLYPLFVCGTQGGTHWPTPLVMSPLTMLLAQLSAII